MSCLRLVSSKVKEFSQSWSLPVSFSLRVRTISFCALLFVQLLPANAQSADPDGAPVISVGDINVPESIGTAIATLTLSKATNTTVTVTVFTRKVANSAEPTLDYYGRTLVAKFLPGQTTQTIGVAIVNDAVKEDAEQLEIRLNNALGADIEDAVATITIVDDDSAGGSTPRLTVADQTVSEGAATAAIEVKLSDPANSEITVTAFTRAAGSAVPGSDFYGTSQILNFAAGETAKFLNVTILDDYEYEEIEAFDVRLINANGAEIERGRATISLTDNEDRNRLPVLWVPSQSIEETVGVAEIVVNLVPPQSQPVRVTAFTHLNGTASGGLDLYGTAQEIVFAPGETRKIFFVTVLDDTEHEATETFNVRLGNSNGIQAGNSATIQIVDDDSPPLPVVSMEPVTASEEDGIATITVTVSYSADVEVHSYTRAATAAPGSDFRGKSETLFFKKGGPTAQTVDIGIVDDTLAESSEYFYLKLLFPRGATREREQVRITISDDD